MVSYEPLTSHGMILQVCFKRFPLGPGNPLSRPLLDKPLAFRLAFAAFGCSVLVKSPGGGQNVNEVSWFHLNEDL